MIGCIAALLCGAVNAAEPSELTDKLVRLHIIAASDNEEDQALKLRVRDETLRLMEDPLDGITDAETAMAVIEEHIPMLRSSLQDFLQAEGSSQEVTVELREQYGFPTRQYDTFALPAGRYKALRIILGEGQGQNWWCVVFPPLCAAAAMEELEDSSYEAGLTEDDVGLITQDGTEYVIRFKLLEWIGALQNRFSR